MRELLIAGVVVVSWLKLRALSPSVRVGQYLVAAFLFGAWAAYAWLIFPWIDHNGLEAEVARELRDWPSWWQWEPFRVNFDAIWFDLVPILAVPFGLSIYLMFGSLVETWEKRIREHNRA